MGCLLSCQATHRSSIIRVIIRLELLFEMMGRKDPDARVSAFAIHSNYMLNIVPFSSMPVGAGTLYLSLELSTVRVIIAWTGWFEVWA